MKYLLLVLVLLAACAKDPVGPTMAQLSVDGNGTYSVTYGTSDQVTVKGEDTWSANFIVNKGDTLQLSVKTDQTPATLYMRVEVQEGLLYCRSLYIEPESVGVMNYIVTP
jgi:hypothetical protein